MAHGDDSRVTVVGGGLAGTEAAWQLATRGVAVDLYEMRPGVASPAHVTDYLGELVCSNSLKSTDADTAAGCLKHELRALGSIVLQTAERHRVAAGGALAVDRITMARDLTETVSAHPLVRVIREEVDSIPSGRVIIASGPLSSPALDESLTGLVGESRLSFFDAAAPIIDAASLDHSSLFAASRYSKGEGADYLNASMNREEYSRFLDALVNAERVITKDFERRELFAACQPVEEVARSGPDALRYGALKPVGLTDPRSGERPWAIVQLRAENAHHAAYNLVGFQTNLTWPEQRRVFSMIPGLEHADFLRYGVMHRNTFVDAPRVLDRTLAVRVRPEVRLAGQITGTEGYLEAAASGLLAGVNTWADLAGSDPVVLPQATVLGALLAYATDPQTANYQPMHVNFGLVPPLDPPVRGKRSRYAAYAGRARNDLAEWMRSCPAFVDRNLR